MILPVSVWSLPSATSYDDDWILTPTINPLDKSHIEPLTSCVGYKGPETGPNTWKLSPESQWIIGVSP
jgi:hypothetical protein